jgi:hypothetical protein
LNGSRIYLKLRAVAGASKLSAALIVALTAAPVSDGDLRAMVNRLAEAVASGRRLSLRPSIATRLVAPGTLERDPEDVAGPAAGMTAIDTSLFRRLGVLASDTAGRSSTGPAAARYDPSTGFVLVSNDIALDTQRPALAHEIAHALEDRRFGLRRFLGVGADGAHELGGDEERARLAVVEGDATLAALTALYPQQTFLAAPELAALVARLDGAFRRASDDRAPWLSALARFTHVDGFAFVAQVRALHPWSAVDALWSDPPASTEQVLHPDRYDSCEAPIAVDEAALPSIEGFGRPSGSDVVGELGARAWLSLALPPQIAERAAAGWGGDRAGVYGAEVDVVDAGAAVDDGPLAWLTVWDDPGEADDFVRAASRVLAHRLETADGPTEPPLVAADGSRAVFQSSRGIEAVARAGAAVGVLLDVPPRALVALDEMLAGWRRREAVNLRAANRPRRAAQPSCRRRERAAGSR